MRAYLHQQILDDGKIYMLTERLRAGDHSAIEPLILTHIPLAAHFAGQMESKFRYRGGECLNAALYGLVKAVNRAKEPETLRDNNITPYLIVCIKGEIRDFVQHDHIIPIPRSASRRGIVNSIKEEYKEYLEEGKEDFLASELLGACKEHGLTERESEIIKMYYDGYTYSEIAEKIGVSIAMIGKIMSRIREKWNQNQARRMI